MINKKNLWFLTLFSLVLVLSVYYITMPRELMMTNNGNTGIGDENVNIYEMSLIETLREKDNNTVLEEINKYKNTIGDSETTVEDKNKAFDQIKLLNQISSQEELLEEKVKNVHNLDSFIKIDGDQSRVVIDNDKHTSSLANDIMRTIQSNFQDKKYISVQFK